MSIRDELVRCPFDEHHRVSRARFPVHLIKCRKQHKGKNFSICPYNATHYVLTPEFQFHLENCPDRKEKELTAPVPDDTYIPPKQEIKVPPPAESWDNEDANCISYLDVKDSLIAKLPILRSPAGLTKSERKRFMRREVHRFHTLARESASAAGQEDTQEEYGATEEGEEYEEGAVGEVDSESTEGASYRATQSESDNIDDPLPEVGDDGGGEFYVVRRRGNHRRGDR